MTELFRRFDNYDDLKPLLDASDEEVLVRLARPTLIRIPALGGAITDVRARLVSCLLHGNEDSGYRAVVDLLRNGERYPFDLWVFIGNVRAATTGGWFAHRQLDDQEDFNRVWGVDAPTTRMRRCADAVLAELGRADLEAAVDLHNNTGVNPYYAIMPTTTREGLELASVCADTLLEWGQRLHTLMEGLSPRCPAVAVECGVAGEPESTRFASGALSRFLAAPGFDTDGADPPRPRRMFQLRSRVIVRPEVPFAFGGQLTDELDFVITPGLDGHNFGMLLAGTELGRVHPGTAMPLCATDLAGRDVTERYFRVLDDGRVVVTEDLTPIMMTQTAQQTRRDCFFYVARRRV